MSDTQWPVYEVFHQSKTGEPHVHVGSVHAPDAKMALMLARDQFARRQSCVSLWVVPTEQITATSFRDNRTWFEHATDKSYRDASGFGMREIFRKLEAERRDE
jgi:ring-1,2-phenylacetyl-CoA epoxidase subunit PaaB